MNLFNAGKYRLIAELICRSEVADSVRLEITKNPLLSQRFSNLFGEKISSDQIISSYVTSASATSLANHKILYSLGYVIAS